MSILSSIFQHSIATRDECSTQQLLLIVYMERPLSLRIAELHGIGLPLAQDAVELRHSLVDQLALEQLEDPTLDLLRQLRLPKRDFRPTFGESLLPIFAYGMVFEGMRQRNR